MEGEGEVAEIRRPLAAGPCAQTKEPHVNLETSQLHYTFALTPISTTYRHCIGICAQERPHIFLIPKQFLRWGQLSLPSQLELFPYAELSELMQGCLGYMGIPRYFNNVNDRRRHRT